MAKKKPGKKPAGKPAGKTAKKPASRKKPSAGKAGGRAAAKASEPSPRAVPARPGYDGPSVSVVIPVYNEEATVVELLSRVEATGIPSEIVVVDDGSTDATRAVLGKYVGREPYRIVFKEANEGKGSALRRGFAESTKDIIIIQDADLEYDPSEYEALLQPIREGRADAVFGSRLIGGGPHRVLYFWHAVGNKFLTTLSNMLTNLSLTDMETCYKVFRRGLIEKMDLKSDKFGIEPELTAKLARAKARIYEVPISYHGRTYAEGKKIGWVDGLAAMWWVLRYGVAD